MTKDKTYDPFEGFKRMSEMWENQINGLLYMMTDNNEFVRLLKVGTESHARYLELLRKNQELMANIMNIPTKKDVANVAKLSIQAEEKIDILEEQIWNLQDSIGLMNKENLEMIQGMVQVIKEMTTEFQKISEELAESKKAQAELHELHQGLVDLKIVQINIQELRKEMEDIKGIKADLQEIRNAKDYTDIQTNLLELKQELTQLNENKTEILKLKNPSQRGKVKDKDKEKESELVLTGSDTSK